MLPGLHLDRRELLIFVVLGLGAALGSMLFVATERNHGFTTALVFTAAAVMLLPPALIALMGLAQYGPDLVRRRYPWFLQIFNVANFTLNALAAWGAAQLVTQALPAHAEIGYAVGAAAACVVLVGSNHVLLAGALRLARARSIRETGLFAWNSLSTDLLLASLGVTIAGVWLWNPYMLPLTIAPLVLVSRSFSLLERLQQSERRFRAIYESTAMGIGLTDTSGRDRRPQPRVRRDAGASPEKSSREGTVGAHRGRRVICRGRAVRRARQRSSVRATRSSSDTAAPTARWCGVT